MLESWTLLREQKGLRDKIRGVLYDVNSPSFERVDRIMKLIGEYTEAILNIERYSDDS